MAPRQTCSECEKKTKRLEARGRPRLTCSDICARKRIQRMKREAYEWAQQEARATAANKEYLEKDAAFWKPAQGVAP